MRAASIALVALLIGCQPEEQEEPILDAETLIEDGVFDHWWMEGETLVVASPTDTVRWPKTITEYTDTFWVEVWGPYDSTVMALPNSWNTYLEGDTTR